MASEPLDENESTILIERRRWGDGSKVYTRRFYKAQRNNSNNNSATATATATATTAATSTTTAAVPNGDEVDKGDENSCIFNRNAPEKSSPTLAAEDGISSQQDPPPRQEQPAAVLLAEDSERLGQEEDASCDGIVGPGSREVVVALESEEAMVPQESREGMVLPESRGVVVALASEEAMVQQESREVVMLPGSREAVVALESEEAMVPQESREGVVLLESRGVVVALESEEAMVQKESREVVMLPESREAVMLPGSREAVMLPGSREAVVALESEEALGPQESREVVMLPESREAVMALESEEAMVPQESREVVMLPESREEVVALESEEAMVPLESEEAVMQPGSREAVVALESREVVVVPQASGNGAAEANGVVKPQQHQQPQLVELQLQARPAVITRVEDRVRINVSGARSRDEIRELRMELETELDQVRSLFKKIEAKELQLTAYNRSNLFGNIHSSAGMVNGNNNNSIVSSFGGGVGNFGGYSQPQYVRNDFVERRALTRVNSEVGSVGHQETRPFSRSLSVSVVENNHGVGEFVEREKRTPKANQFYRNSEFLLGKDRLPPESNKKLKPNGAGRKHGGEGDHGFGYGFDKQQRERVFRSCSSLLQRLMKHKFGWVFNVPVDAKKLGLHDYHDIIKHPMDLGTIKTRLSQNFYKSPKEFGEDVRLVFHNAMTYNPKGQDVHVMAETLLQIFEERWAVIQTEYNPDWRYQMYRDAGLPTPTSRKAPPTQFYTPAPAPIPIPIPVTPVPQMRTLDRSESMTTPVDPKLKPSHFTLVGRTPVPKKPKAKDPNKRDMTYEEKQKLSTNLQSLPSEKLDAIVQIIKKRNSTLNQHDDEIEVDIDSVDAETLWELDRFVTNYKKNLSKNKRKAEIALQARDIAAQTIPVTNTAPAIVDAQKESRIGENNAPPPVQVEKQGNNASRSSSSSSSSSDSGSSSSDSDSDSSSAYGSDAGRSPVT